MAKIAIIDDEKKICELLQKILISFGYEASFSLEPQEFVYQLQPDMYCCLLLDLRLGDKNGLDYLEEIQRKDPHLPIIIMTAHETVQTAVEAMKKGAFHYISKPFDNDELEILVQQASKLYKLHAELKAYKMKEASQSNLELEMGHSEIIQRLRKQVFAVSKIPVSVLLTGESGTGKELVAKAIHAMSLLTNGPFVVIDCASIPETLIESELFGYEKGAFTGAVRSQLGKLEQAHGGTLFLDEISNIPFTVQAKLLRFLETRISERLGGRKEKIISTRIIAATNKVLPELIDKKIFREDLYHRLNEFPILLPPLRERSEDISYLALKFTQEFEVQIGKKISNISDQALKTLQAYPWPGNVRELRNVIKRAMVHAVERIEHIDLPEEVYKPLSYSTMEKISVPLRRDLSLYQATKEAIKLIEETLIRNALKLTGKKGKAAILLGIDEKTLYNKLKEYNIHSF